MSLNGDIVCESAKQFFDDKVVEEEVEECPICYEPIKKYGFCTTNCDHTFCMDCMVRHLQINQSCPLCRGEVAPPPDNVQPDNDTYELGFEVGYEQGVEDTEVNIAEVHQQGFQEGSESVSQFAQEWRSRYFALNKIYKATVTQLQKHNSLKNKSENLGLKRTLSL
uniref:RING-type domain-containing protein n=1 Tax=viral metagenome TaxID=1070528 RepID=A0A6C0C6R4_9ZZZZ